MAGARYHAVGKTMGVEGVDAMTEAESAFADACCPGNPWDTSVEKIKELYRGLL